MVGQVTTGLIGAVGGQVEIKPSGNELPVWPNATRHGIRITSDKFAPIRLILVVTPELAGSFRPPEQARPPAVKPPEQPSAEQAAAAVQQSANLELLLGVKLEATIRFGQKQMLLREVLELHPGVAISLDRKLEEPVELLVGGRMVARGEVVIVDGNYGLRVTDIVCPQNRIDLLWTSM